MSVSTPANAMPPTPPVPIHEAPSLPQPPPPTADATPLVVYRIIFPDLVNSFRDGRYEEVIKACEDAEILYPEVRERPTRLLVTIPLVLSYLCLDNLPPAKFALMRLPRVLQSFAPIRVLYDLLVAVHYRHYPVIYAAAGNLVSAATGSLKEDAELDLAIGPMVSGFVDNYRKRVFNVLARSYVALPVRDAEAYLGMSPTDVIAACKANGWTYDEATSAVRPPAPSQKPKELAAPSTMLQFSRIVDGAAKFESFI